jgi:micrococcal nuclease
MRRSAVGLLGRVLLLAMSVAFAAPAWAHPGPVSPRDGCHVCRQQCHRWGIPPGRHCHPERLSPRTHAPSPAAPRPQARDAAPADALDGRTAYVEKVVDGDTLTVRVDGQRVKIRVLGIDCPESHANEKCARDGRAGRRGCREQVPLGRQAARRAAQLLKHRTVTLEGPTKTDLYGRTLAYVRLPDGRDFGAVMIAEGLCEDFGWKYPHPRMKQGQYRP